MIKISVGWFFEFGTQDDVLVVVVQIMRHYFNDIAFTRTTKIIIIKKKVS